MSKRSFEDILNDLRDADVDEELLDQLEAYKGSKLRERAEKAGELEAELATIKAENEALKSAPQRAKAFEDYGIDLASLRPAEREALESAEVGEEGFTPEWVASLAEKYDLAVDQSAGDEGDEQPAAAQIAAQARASGQRSDKTTIKPEDARSWAPDQMIRFKEQHSEAWEQLKRGETVVGVPAPAA